jgi:hypothetical protein
MKNELKNNIGGDVQKSHKTPTAAAVIPRSVQRGSDGQLACGEDSSRKLNALGKVDGNAADKIPCFLTDGKECAAPSSLTTPQPPSFEIAPAWIAAWQTKLSAR